LRLTIDDRRGIPSLDQSSNPHSTPPPPSARHEEDGPPFGDRRLERRDLASRAALVERFRAEFRQMPGLWVTRSDARRLFGVAEDICQRVLDVLVRDGALIRTSGGIYRTPPRLAGRREQ